MARQAIKISGNIDALKLSINALNGCMAEIMDKNSEDHQPEVRVNLPDCVTIFVHGSNDKKLLITRITRTFPDLKKEVLTTHFGQQYSYFKGDAEILTVVSMTENDAYMRNWKV